jgi:uncharacterized protein YgiM (DUF1202 family)
MRIVRSLLIYFLLVMSIGPTTLGAQTQPDAPAEGEASRFVQIVSVKVRSKPQHWASATVTLKYGDSVSVQSEERSWAKVRTESGSEGFSPSSAITVRAVILKSNTGLVRLDVDQADVVLAARGFNESLEEALATGDATINFAAVDQMQNDPTKEEQIVPFMQAGDLPLEVDG